MAIARLGRRGMVGSHEEPQLETFSPLSHLTVVLQLQLLSRTTVLIKRKTFLKCNQSYLCCRLGEPIQHSRFHLNYSNIS